MSSFHPNILAAFFQLFLIQDLCDSSDRDGASLSFRFALRTDNHARLGINASICELKTTID